MGSFDAGTPLGDALASLMGTPQPPPGAAPMPGAATYGASSPWPAGTAQPYGASPAGPMPQPPVNPGIPPSTYSDPSGTSDASLIAQATGAGNAPGGMAGLLGSPPPPPQGNAPAFPTPVPTPQGNPLTGPGSAGAPGSSYAGPAAPSMAGNTGNPYAGPPSSNLAPPLPPPTTINTPTGPVNPSMPGQAATAPPPPSPSPGAPNAGATWLSGIFGADRNPATNPAGAFGANMADPRFMRQIGGSLGEGLKAVGSNWNKPGLAAFAGTLGSAIEGGQKGDSEYLKEKEEALDRKTKADALAEKDKSDKARMDYYMARLNAASRAGTTAGRTGAWQSSDVGKLHMADDDVEKQIRQEQILRKKEYDEADPKTKQDMRNEWDQKRKDLRNEAYKERGIDPNKADEIRNRGADSKNPHQPSTWDEFQAVVQPGQWYKNPSDGKIYRRKESAPTPADAPGGIGATTPGPESMAILDGNPSEHEIYQSKEGASQELPGFKTGGEFDVGGDPQDGEDSQVVQFKATPGEHVTIDPPETDGAAPATADAPAEAAPADPEAQIDEAAAAQEARDVAAKRMKQAVKPEEGRKEGDLTEAGFDAIIPGRKALRDVTEGNYKDAAIDAASNLVGWAPEPVRKVAGKVASKVASKVVDAVSAAPKSTAAALGAAMAATPTSAEEAPPLQQGEKKEWYNITPREPPFQREDFTPSPMTADEQAQFQYPAPPEKPPEQPVIAKGAGPKAIKQAQDQWGELQKDYSATKTTYADRIAAIDDARRAFYENRTESEKTAHEAKETAREAAWKAKDAAADAADQEFRHKNQSFAEAHPYLAAGAPYAGAAAGAMVPRLARGVVANTNRQAIQKMEDAVTRGEAAASAGKSADAIAQRSGALEGLETAQNRQLPNANPSIISGPGAANVAASGLAAGGLSLEGALAPYQIDQGSNLDPRSPAYQAANRPFAEKLSDRGGLAELPTFGASMAGAELPLLRHMFGGVPTAPTEKIADTVKTLRTIEAKEKEAAENKIKAKAEKAAAAAEDKRKSDEAEAAAAAAKPKRIRKPKATPPNGSDTSIQPNGPLQ